MSNALVELKNENKNLQARLIASDEENVILHEQVRLLKARLFAPKTEKSALLLDQLDLFEIDPVAPDPDADLHSDDEDHKGEDKTKTTGKKGSKRLPKHLPRRTVDHYLSEEERGCGCSMLKCIIGQDLTEELAYIPAKLEVILHIWHLYACPDCKGNDDFKDEPGVASAPRPRMIPGGMAGESLLAHVMTAKYVDGLPFNRITGQLERLGFTLSRATMSNWSKKIGERLIPLWHMLLDEVKGCSYLQMDETVLQVLREKGRRNQSNSYMWVIWGGPPGKRIIIFKYDPSRGAKVVKGLLEGYTGIVQTDGWVAYDHIDNPLCPMTHAADWNHARRKFTDIVKSMGGRNLPKGSYTARALAMIRKLYKIETRIKKKCLSSEEIVHVRQAEAEPIINQLFSFLKDLQEITPPKGLLGSAVGYALEREEGLRVYLNHGEMLIDTNPVENAIRPFVLGRKAWLFSGHPDGAQASAVIYTMVETAKANGWKADAYLLHLFQNLPKTTKQDLHSLLPTVPPPLDPEPESE